MRRHTASIMVDIVPRYDWFLDDDEIDVTVWDRRIGVWFNNFINCQRIDGIS